LSALSWLKSYVARYTGKVAILLLIFVLSTTASLVPPYLIEILINRVFAASNVGLLFPISLGVLGAYAFGSIPEGSSYFLRWLDQRITRGIRDRVYEYLQRLSMDFYERMSSRPLLSRVVDGVERPNGF